MKKIIVLLLILNGCAYKPIIDSAGRSGTFPTSTAEQVTNDIQHCKMLAEDHLSKADVASSKRRILGFFKKALAMAILYFYPPES